jgi:hypothetical protein
VLRYGSWTWSWTRTCSWAWTTAYMKDDSNDEIREVVVEWIGDGEGGVVYTVSWTRRSPVNCHV